MTAASRRPFCAGSLVGPRSAPARPPRKRGKRQGHGKGMERRCPGQQGRPASIVKRGNVQAAPAADCIKSTSCLLSAARAGNHVGVQHAGFRMPPYASVLSLRRMSRLSRAQGQTLWPLRRRARNGETRWDDRCRLAPALTLLYREAPLGSRRKRANVVGRGRGPDVSTLQDSRGAGHRTGATVMSRSPRSAFARSNAAAAVL